MTKSKDPKRGQNWTRILKEAGIPESPGYVETVRKLYPKEETK